MLSDRFVDSSLAYQGGAGGLGIETVRAINAFAIGEYFPDRTLVLMLDDGAERAEARDRAEATGSAAAARIIITKSTVAFRLIATEEPDRVRLVDGSGAPEAVTQRLLDAIADLLP